MTMTFTGRMESLFFYIYIFIRGIGNPGDLAKHFIWESDVQLENTIQRGTTVNRREF